MSETAPICVPGQRLCLADDKHLPGQGTYERQGYIYSCLAGTVDVVETDNVEVIEVHSRGERTTVPVPGDVVTAQIVTLAQQFAKANIKCVGDVTLARPARAMLRREDVRATEKDKIDIYECFRPGDIILARVMPISEAHSYQLTTAENELGVVIARSENGYPMVPISWTAMQCTRTFKKEPRKVAKVLPETYTHSHHEHEEDDNQT